eukprot:SAG11_NODE_4980_length_1704_cov_2.055452_1_plen_393_part_10
MSTLPPQVDLTGSCTEPCAIGNWHLKEARGGYEGRFAHLILCHKSPAHGVQISLAQADEWGESSGAFHFRLGESDAVKISEDNGAQTADMYSDMPAAHLYSDMPTDSVPPLCCPGEYSWGGGRWVLTGGETGWVVVTHKVQAGNPFCLNLLADGGAGLTDASGNGHILSASAGLLESKWAVNTSMARAVGAILAERRSKEEAVRAVKEQAEQQAREQAEREEARIEAQRLQSQEVQEANMQHEIETLRGELKSHAAMGQNQRSELMARVAIAGDGNVSKAEFSKWSEAQAVKIQERDSVIDEQFSRAIENEDKLEEKINRIETNLEGLRTVVAKIGGTSDRLWTIADQNSDNAAEVHLRLTGLDKKIADTVDMMADQSSETTEAFEAKLAQAT